MKPEELLLYYPYVYTKEVPTGWANVIVQFIDWDIRKHRNGYISTFHIQYKFRQMPEYTDEYMGYGVSLSAAQNIELIIDDYQVKNFIQPYEDLINSIDDL